MNKKLIIGLAIGVPLLVGGIYFYRKSKRKNAVRRRNTNNSDNTSEESITGRQQIYNLQQQQALAEFKLQQQQFRRDSLLSGGQIVEFSNLDGRVPFKQAWDECGKKCYSFNSPKDSPKNCLEQCLNSKGWTIYAEPYTSPKSSPKSTTLTNFY